MKFLFAFLFLAWTPSLWANGCQDLVGHYSIATAGCVAGYPGKMSSDSAFFNVAVQYDTETNALAITYNDDGMSSFTENYIADGAEHAGDLSNTGKTYTASCGQDHTISIRRVGLFVDPFDTVVVTTADGVSVKNTFEDDAFVRECQFVKSSAP